MWTGPLEKWVQTSMRGDSSNGQAGRVAVGAGHPGPCSLWRRPTGWRPASMAAGASAGRQTGWRLGKRAGCWGPWHRATEPGFPLGQRSSFSAKTERRSDTDRGSLATLTAGRPSMDVQNAELPPARCAGRAPTGFWPGGSPHPGAWTWGPGKPALAASPHGPECRGAPPGAHTAGLHALGHSHSTRLALLPGRP